ncbi:MAG: NADH-quinone oxidoreductase subunit L, partial [Thermofilaceae archaeon]
MYEWINLLWIMPTLCAVSIPLLSKISKLFRDIAPLLVCTATAVTAALLPKTLSRAPVLLKFDWVFLPGFGKVQFGLYIDTCSIVMSNVVAWISLAVFIYSLGYMKDDSSLDRYWFFMLLFLGGMELLVISENLIQMLFGWEIVGICSFALISYWYKDLKEDKRVKWVGEPPEEYPPSHCGLKAFLVTRLGDTFIVAGIITLSIIAKTTSFAELLTFDIRSNQLLHIALALLFIGAMGKSAQLPLTEWLPDAMAGPTSASALIHAATMVKAGVFLTARVVQIALAWGLETYSPSLFEFILWIGVLTAFIAALQATATSELKKTLAYSTISQVGYMLAGLGTASLIREQSLASTFFHLISHAVFKSTLFLCAGVMIHIVGSRFYEDLKGVGRHMK